MKNFEMGHIYYVKCAISLQLQNYYKHIIDLLNSGIRGGINSNGFSRLAFSSEFVTYF